MCHFHNLANIDRGFLSYLALSPHISQRLIFMPPFIMNYSSIPEADRKRAHKNMLWSVMDARGVALLPEPAHGVIHDFEGADQEAERLNKETYYPLTCLPDPYTFKGCIARP